MGLLDAAIGGYFSWTNAQTVFDLESRTLIAGVSGGYKWYVGADLLTIQTDDWRQHFGFQLQAGLGVGIDMHVMVPETTTLFSFNINDNPLEILARYLLYKVSVNTTDATDACE